MAYKVIFFDVDGTLVDSNEQHVNAWALAFREAGHPQELEDIRRQIGKGADLLIPMLMPAVDPAVCDMIAEAHSRYFEDMYLDNIRPFGGASDHIRKVHDDGGKVVLVSSAGRPELDHYVDLLDVASSVSASTSADDVDRSKTAPDIFDVAMNKAGVEPSDGIAVGDTVYDIEAAGRSGMVSIGLLSGAFGDAELRDAGAIAVYVDVAELLVGIQHSPLRSNA